MPTTQPRLRIAKLLLWLAIPLMAIAQCLPWEIVRVYSHGTFATASTDVSQIPHSWTFTHPSNPPDPLYRRVSEGISLDEPVTIRSELLEEEFPAEIPIRHLDELWYYASQLLTPSSYPPRRLITWALVALIAWPLCFLAMLLCPFFAEPLSRARPILWLVRFFACSMLIWLLRNFTLSFDGLGTAAAGLWLTLAALALVISGLFLLPHPRPPRGNILQPS